MSVLENFKNILRSPYWGATGLKCIFFLQICKEVPGGKKRGGLSSPFPQRATCPCRPPQGRPTSGPSLQAPGGAVAPPAGDRGGLSPPPLAGDRVSPPYIRPPTSFPPHLTSKNPPKIQKKERGEKKGSSEALPNSALVIYR